MRKLFNNSVLILITAFLFLFAPKPNGSNYCGSYIKLNKAMGFLIDCDSYQYILLSMHPAKLLDKDSVARRQNRPLYIIATYAIGKPIEYTLFKVYHSALGEKLDLDKLLNSEKLLKRLEISTYENQNKYTNTADNSELVLKMIAYYIAYLILNFVLLLASLHMFEKLLLLCFVQQKIINILRIVLVANTIVKGFLYSAHEQMFLFLTPVLMVYVLYQLVLVNNDRKRYGISFLFGVACLAYGSFVLYLPALWLLFLYEDKSIKNALSKAVNYILHAILFLVPTICWIIACHKISGHYYNHEVEKFRELVWITDTLKIGVLLFIKTLAFNIAYYLFFFVKAVLPFLIVFIILWKKNKTFKISEKYKQLNVVLLICFIVFTAFFALLGYYSYRLSFSSSILVLIGIAAQLQLLFEHQPEKTAIYKRNLLIVLSVWCLLVFIF
ncbi:MAG: hypothetical protein U0U67_15015 [Chitinophagales bacterium]